MPPIQFKLTKSDDFTRRATFQQLPNWNELAAKLQALYNISADRVGVSYIDNDNDEITVNSNEELQDFYQGSYKSGQVIKLHVLDLNKTRETPRIPTANRNTFGQDDFDFPADNDWQRLPPFSIAELFMGKESVSDGPHAFVEVLDSDISGFGKDVDNMSDTDSEGGRSTVQPSSVDKGKNKSSSFGAASVTSLVAEEASEKYPVHVLDHGSVKNGPPPSAAPPAASNPFSDPQPNITAQSTPKVQSQKVDTPQAQDTSVDVNMEDPPLPELDAPQQSNASASLSSDIATVLTTFTSVISSHPELSEGVRNIIRNATNGTYWQSHRSAMSQAAREMSRPAEEYNHDEAVRRISDALGGIFRSLSQTSANGESGNQQANQPANANPFDWHTPHFMRPPPPGGRAPWSRRFTTALDEGRPWHHWYAPPWTAGPHHPHGPPPPPPPPGFPGPPPPMPPPPPPPPNPPPPGVKLVVAGGVVVTEGSELSLESEADGMDDPDDDDDDVNDAEELPDVVVEDMMIRGDYGVGGGHWGRGGGCEQRSESERKVHTYIRGKKIPVP
ncbi:hypothetical protein NLJ89_g5188 [Agrocybe chaxingu]|uniref:PB1 domain-containing protein n=1 Tax=Agrocybe chaxingu TaxID=84603 RepID=A0A9W8K8N0_9AGAR|nr:hypothetical protein NLJ89_g5188 [Agrocybe chaxingu]